MINSPLDILLLLYIALTQSLFVQIFAIVIFRIAAYICYNSKPNWYYPEDTDA